MILQTLELYDFEDGRLKRVYMNFENLDGDKGDR
jgi:hypothetical protein